MSLSPTPLDSVYQQAERALRKPSSAVWLRSVSIRTARFDEALHFYERTLGLTLGRVDVHPLTGRARARMLDAEGHTVLQIVEGEGATPAVHELAFEMPRRTVLLLRSRLDLQNVPYTDAGSAVYLHDVDGTTVCVEAL